MNKIFIFRLLIITLMIGLLIWDGLRILRYPSGNLPEQEKDLLLTATLLWIITAFVSQRSNDDDWAGKF